jgi:hypothetical protein
VQIATTQNGWGLDKNYLQCADIDFAGADLNRIGSSNAAFTGKFNGDGHKISNANVVGASPLGLFSVVGAAGEIKNMILENIHLSAAVSVMGMLAGKNQGLVDHISAVGSLCFVEGNANNSSQIGGLVGLNDTTGVVKRSMTNIRVHGVSKVGGIVGENLNRSATNPGIQDSYSLGAIEGTSRVGGIAGYNDGKILNTYALAPQLGHAGISTSGGIVGESSSSSQSSVIASYWDADVSGIQGDPISQPVNKYGTSMTTTAMQMQMTYSLSGWDFQLIWMMPENSYPSLK